MSSSALPNGRYAVVEDNDQVGDIVFGAIRSKGSAVIHVLREGDGLHTVSFCVQTTGHDEHGSLIIGITDDERVVNLHLPAGGKPFAVIFGTDTL